MPVLDHEIHESVRHGTEFRYGCWNLPRVRKQIEVQDGWTEDGRRNMKVIDDFGSLECRYDMSLKDNGCAECQWRGSGEDYDRMIRMSGN